MKPIEAFFGIDWKALGVAIFTALIGFQAIVKLLDWFLFDYLGIETKSMRTKRIDHELLIKTAKNLEDIETQRKNDVEQSIKHDKQIKKDLNDFMNEMRSAIQDTQRTVERFADNRVHDREQSLEIQKELTDSINKIAVSDSQRDDQIDSLITSQKESLADRINQKYKYYLSINGVPEDEYDEFISLHSAYKRLGGNHNGDAKFNYCIDHLPIIPATVKLKYDTDK